VCVSTGVCVCVCFCAYIVVSMDESDAQRDALSAMVSVCTGHDVMQCNVLCCAVFRLCCVLLWYDMLIFQYVLTLTIAH
jgi:hypothetical protein